MNKLHAKYTQLKNTDTLYPCILMEDVLKMLLRQNQNYEILLEWK
jgi:hypothetical protein